MTQLLRWVLTLYGSTGLGVWAACDGLLPNIANMGLVAAGSALLVLVAMPD